MQDKVISIWFFIGSLLLFYGILIMGYGIYRLLNPAATMTVLAGLHPDVWWGAFLLIIGAIYCVKYSPRKQ